MRYIVGIDEAGRGPLAGPVAVAAVMVLANFSKKFFKGIRDSKQLSVGEREFWFALALETKKCGDLDFAVTLIKHSIIDKHGIVYAINLGIKRCLSKLNVDENSAQIFLDGGIRAPLKFAHQLTVVKGDEKIPVISLASIIAKVTRDKYMVKLSESYPEYSFDTNKGYGTRVHFHALKINGLTPIHRRSFLKNLLPPQLLNLPR